MMAKIALSLNVSLESHNDTVESHTIQVSPHYTHSPNHLTPLPHPGPFSILEKKQGKSYASELALDQCSSCFTRYGCQLDQHNSFLKLYEDSSCERHHR